MKQLSQIDNVYRINYPYLEEGYLMRDNVVLSVPIQFLAWVILVLSLSLEQLSWFLIPNVNNTPAFITVSIWLIQCLVIANLIFIIVNMFLKRYKISDIDWKLFPQTIVAFLHIVVISVLIILIVGFEDL
jgi:hypothetical protein